MQAWSIEDIPPQRGKLALVTGATGGLGLETALALAQAGAEVVLLGRNPDKGRLALERIRGAAPRAAVRFEHLDLASFGSVQACSDKILAATRPIDLLVNNAGVMALPTRQVTVDGYETQLATNHLGHFLLTARLLPLIRQSPVSRVVNVSSLVHRIGGIDFDDLQAQRRYNPTRAYGQSKLANLLFTFELQRRSARGDWGVSSVAAHPGGSSTDLIANGPGTEGLLNALSLTLVRTLGQPAAAGALPTLFASTSPDAKPGGYYGPNGVFELRGPPAAAHVSARAKDVAVSRRLWDVSVDLTGASWPDP